jgi:long-chain acyl-CoA synthetase
LPMYGQTEATARLAYLPAEDVDEFIDTIGKAIPGVELDVFDSEYRSVEPNITGELVARGDNILLGYLDDEISTKERIIDGWLHTGDLAQKLPNGYIKLLGRKDDIIKIGDHRVNPREIERDIEENKFLLCLYPMNFWELRSASWSYLRRGQKSIIYLHSAGRACQVTCVQEKYYS